MAETSTQGPTVYKHPSPGHTLFPILKECLPYSLPIHRRLQFPQRSAHSVILSTFSPNKDVETIESCFCAAYVDRSTRPETEVFLFVSGEVPGRCSGLSTSPGDEKQHCPSCSAAVLAVLNAIRSLVPTPPSIAPGTSTTGFNAHLTNPSVTLLGSTGSFPTSILSAHNCIRTDMPGLAIPYTKHVFHTSALLPAPTPQDPSKKPAPATPLPQGLFWRPLRAQDLPVVVARTAIPRVPASLQRWPSAAIFAAPPDGPADAYGSPVAWAFLGPDASLSSLHVEPDWRGRGLAKAVARRVFLTGTRAFVGERRPSAVEGEEDDDDADADAGWREGKDGWLAHADVTPSNAASTAVCRSLGGKSIGEVFWLRVDLDRVKQVVEERNH